MAQTNWWDQIMPAIESVPGKIVQADNQFLPGMQELYNTTEGALGAMGVNNPQTQAVAQQQAQNSPTQNLVNSIPGASQVNGLMGGIEQVVTPQVAAVQKGLNITPTQQTQQQEAQYKANSPMTNLISGANTAAALGGIALGGSDDMANATGEVLNSGVQNIKDTFSNAAAQPGGLQAGYIGDSTAGEEANTPPEPSQEELDANARRGIQLNGKDIKTQDDIDNVNASYNKYGGTGSPMSQVTNTFKDNGAVDQLSQQAQTVLDASGGTTSRDVIDKMVMDELKGNVNATQIGAKNLDEGIQQYTDDIYNRAVGGKATPTTTSVPGSGIFQPTTSWQELPKGVGQLPSEGGFEQWTDPNSGKVYVKWDDPPSEPIPVQSQTITRLMPEQVPDSVLYKMKTIMNQDAASTYNLDPKSWTPSQTISRNARDALDNYIDTKYSNIKGINDAQSNLFKGYDQVMDRANDEIKSTTKVANAPPTTTPKGNRLVGVIKGAAKHPWAVGLATTALAPAVVGGTMLAVNAANPDKSEGQTPSTTTPSTAPTPSLDELQTIPTQIEPAADGTWTSALPNVYGIKDNNNQDIAISDGAYIANNQALDALQNSNVFYTNTTQGKTIIANAHDVLDKAHTKSGALNQAYNNATQVLPLIDEANGLLNKKNTGNLGTPNWSDAIPLLGKFGIQEMQGGINTNYGKLLQLFNKIQTTDPSLKIDFSNVGSTQEAQSLLKEAAQQAIATVNITAKNMNKNIPDFIMPGASSTKLGSAINTNTGGMNTPMPTPAPTNTTTTPNQGMTLTPGWGQMPASNWTPYNVPNVLPSPTP